MKKILSKHKVHYNKDLSINTETQAFKTTDINILLNRVRIQKKDNRKNKIKIGLLFIFLIIIISSISLIK